MDLVASLVQCAVLPQDLAHPEYCFCLQVDFTKTPKDDPGVDKLKQILTGLLNTSGGILVIQSSSGKQPTKKTLNGWKQKLEESLIMFIPLKIYHSSIRLLDYSFPCVMIITASPEIITVNSHMYVRGLVGNRAVNDIDHIRDVMMQTSSTKCAAYPFEEFSTLDYGQSVKFDEGPNIEFKFWKVTEIFENAERKGTYRCRLQEARTQRTLFALPNMPEGGYLILGIEEDDKSKENVIRGQIITEDDQDKLSRFFTEFIKKDDEGNRRYWCNLTASQNPHTDDCTIKFIPVVGGPVGESRMVIVVTSKTLSDQQVPTQTREPFVLPEAVTRDPSYNTDSEHDDMAPSSGTKKHDSEKGNHRLVLPTENLLWTEHKHNWSDNLPATTINLEENVHKIANISNLFEMSECMNLTPTKDTAIRSQVGKEDHVKKAFDHIQISVENKKSFGIVSFQWISNMQTDSTLIAPKGHIMDVFNVDEIGHIILWSIVEENITDLKKIWQHLFLSGRLTKRNLLFKNKNLDTTSVAKTLWVRCRVYQLNKGEQFFPTSYNIATIFDAQQNHLNNLKLPLARTLVTKESHIRSVFGDELSIVLTAEQMEIVLSLGLDKFNFIEGPPGCGKTYIALHLCRKYPDYMYVCTTLTFRKLLLHQGLKEERLFVLTTQQDFKTLMSGNIVKKSKYIIMDDIQNMDFPTATWITFFTDLIKAHDTKLIILGDSIYQNIKLNLVNVKSVMQAFCSDHNYHLTLKTLTDIHRNTRKVASFIKANFARNPDYPDHSQIRSSHTEDGDDIEIRHLANIMSFDWNNGLVAFIISLIEPETNMDNQYAAYQPKDIAILVDRKDHVDALLDTLMIRLIFSQNDDLTMRVHDAGTFPVSGLTLDTLDNFIGFDRRVCILITDKDSLHADELSQRSIADPRYRTFVASRGLMRVVFVMQSELDVGTVTHFKLDKIPFGVRERLWHRPDEQFISVCHVGEQNVLLCIVLRRGRETETTLLHPVSIGGDYINKSVDIPRNPFCICSSVTGRRVVIGGRDDDGDDGGDDEGYWAVYRVGPGVELTKVNTYNLTEQPLSACWTQDGDVIMISKDTMSIARMSTADGRIIWRYEDESITHLENPTSVAVCSSSGIIYVSDGQYVRMLSADGHHLRDVMMPGFNSCRAMCVDSTGKFIFAADAPEDEDEDNEMHTKQRDIYLVSVNSHTQKVIRAPGAVFSMILIDDRYLAVGTYNGLDMYDVTSLLLR